MEIWVSVTGDDRGPAELHRWLAVDPGAAWRVTLGPEDHVLVELADHVALSALIVSVRTWVEAQRGLVQATLHGPGYVITHIGDHDSPDADADEITPLDSYGPGTEPYGERATPPGPVIDPGDDWPKG